MNTKPLFVLLILISSALGAFGQNFNYTFKIKGLPAEQDVYLANYFGDRLYYYDTARSTAGQVQFNREEVKGGVYAVVLPGPKTFEIILTENENKIVLETDTTDFVKNMKVIKSDENLSLIHISEPTRRS